jgi:hypothetical protein
LLPEALQMLRRFPDPAATAFGFADIASGYVLAGDMTSAARLAREGLQHTPPGHHARGALEAMAQHADAPRWARLLPPVSRRRA